MPTFSEFDSSSACNDDDYVPLPDRLRKRIASGTKFFSLEFFCPQTRAGLKNLLDRIDTFSRAAPMFVDVTWSERSNRDITKETSTISLADEVLNFCFIDVVLHLICSPYTKEEIKSFLEMIERAGIRNILALRGDRDVSTLAADVGKQPDFLHADELVRFIRAQFGSCFSIGVAGYTAGHPEALSYEDDLRYLKQKVDAGADFVITQLFFEAEEYFRYVADCRRIGVTCPIIPGVFPIQNYHSFQNIMTLTEIKIPPEISKKVESLKHNDEAVCNYGIWQAVELGKQLLKGSDCPGLHMYTLNQYYAVKQILQQLGFWVKVSKRPLPWRSHPAHCKRVQEKVRPIFWSTRPKSYVNRTKDWDRFPNGRWGDSSSPAFGDLKHYHMFFRQPGKTDKLLGMWGKRHAKEEDVWHIFSCFISGQPNNDGNVVEKLPWNEASLADETSLIKDQLLWCNANGILTINSQPNVNGASSDDVVHGWGASGGYVYQKAYLEFFTSIENALVLHKILRSHPFVNYQVSNHDASFFRTNLNERYPVAVTWGVFPGREIMQPTVVDSSSFHLWKDEAFEYWLWWASLYKHAQSSKVLRKIHDTHCLVTLVDNQYPKPSALWDILKDMLRVSGRSSE